MGRLVIVGGFIWRVLGIWRGVREEGVQGGVGEERNERVWDEISEVEVWII